MLVYANKLKPGDKVGFPEKGWLTVEKVSKKADKTTIVFCSRENVKTTVDYLPFLFHFEKIIDGLYITAR